MGNKSKTTVTLHITEGILIVIYAFYDNVKSTCTLYPDLLWLTMRDTVKVVHVNIESYYHCVYIYQSLIQGKLTK